MAAFLEFTARIRTGTAKAWLIEFHGHYAPVWVPKALVQLGEPEHFTGPRQVRLPRHWALSQEPLRLILARRVLGPPNPAPLSLVTQPATPRALAPGAELQVGLNHELYDAWARVGLTHEDAAAVLGMEPMTLSRLEDGVLDFAEAAMWDRAIDALRVEGERLARKAEHLGEMAKD